MLILFSHIHLEYQTPFCSSKCCTSLLNPRLETAARLVRLLVERIKKGVLPKDIFLSVNFPDVLLSKSNGIVITQLAHKTHIDSVQEGTDGRRNYFWLVRRKLEHRSLDDSDIWAIEHGYISITALHTALFRRPAPDMSEVFCKGLFCDLQSLRE